VTASAAASSAGLAVSLRGVRRVFAADEGPVEAVDGVDLDVAPGEFVALLGPSGCGKSTLLRLVAGLERPDAGEVVLSGGDEDHGRALACVFQDSNLLPWRDVLGNVELPLELRGIARAQRRRAAQAAVARVGLEDAATRVPAQLSGGMRMRASMARALVTRPRLLLLDEPFAALDEITRQSLDDALHRLWRASRITVLFVTHSIAEAAFLAERAVVLSRRPARVVLEHRLALPRERDAALRTEAVFARQMRVLQDALRGGSEP
jgi:NitT/TauT family transport system ATP-binding protein